MKWDVIEINYLNQSNKNNNSIISNTNDDISLKIRSFNRSIVFEDQFVGPDLTFLVPIGFKSSEMMNLDCLLYTSPSPRD